MRKSLDLTTVSISGILHVRRMGIGLLIYLLSSLKGLIGLYIYARLLGAAGLGLVTLMILTASLLAPLLRVNTIYTFAVFSSHLTDKRVIANNFYSALHSSFLFSVAGGGLILVSAVLLDLTPEICRYLLLVTFLAFTINYKDYVTVLPQAYQKAGVLSIFTFLTEYVSLGLSLLFIYIGNGANGVILGHIVGYGLCSTFGYYVIYRDIGFRTNIDWPLVKQFVLLSIPVIALILSQWLVQSVDQYFVAYYHDVSQVGIYSAALTISSVILIVHTALTYTFSTTVFRFWSRGEIDRFVTYTISTLKWGIIIFSLGSALLYLSSHWLISFLVSPEFSSADEVILPLVLARSLAAVSMIVSTVLYTVRKPNLILWAFLITVVANIVLNFLLIPRWAVLGAVVATLISYGVSSVFLLVLVKRNIKVNWPSTELIKPALFVIITIFLALLLKPMAVVSFATLILAMTILTGFGFLVILFMRLINSQEMAIVQSLFYFR